MQCAIIAWFTILYFAPKIFGGERDEECTMNIAFANGMFAWVNGGLIVSLYMYFIIGYIIKSKTGRTAILKEWVETAVIIVASLKMFI